MALSVGPQHRAAEVTMRLGKEQSAGYVDDSETEVASPVAVPVVAMAPEPVLAEHEPVTVAR
jgi:hypothetical protein